MYAFKNQTHGTEHVYGLQKAPVELIEYGDFLCGHCAYVYPTVKLLQERMGTDIRFVYRHYPLHAIHPLALEAAMVSEAAALQGKFWAMHDLIYENQKMVQPLFQDQTFF